MKTMFHRVQAMYGMVATIALLYAQPASAQVRIACVGDSITYGVNLTGQGTATGQTYPADLNVSFGSAYAVQNDGYPGLSLMKLNPQPAYHPAYVDSSQYQAAIAFSPNIVVIMLGANDASFAPNAGQTWTQTYNATFISQYESLVNTFKNLSSHPVVYVCKPSKIFGTNAYGIDPTTCNTTINADITTIANATGAKVIDVYTATANSGANFGDNVHPNAAGAQTISNAVYSGIRSQETKPTTAPTNVTATAGKASVALTWTPPSGIVDSFNIYRSTTAGGEGTTPIATGVVGWSYPAVGLTNGTKYYFKVAAVNAAGTGPLSAEVSATPTATSGGPIASGTYTLTPLNATGSRLDATGWGVTNGTVLQIWQAGGGLNQKWVITNMSGTTYKIQPAYATGMAIDVTNGGPANGARLQLWADTGGVNQQWTLTAVSGGYTFTPKAQPTARMDVAGPSSANGTAVQIWTATGGTNQTWSLAAN